jgi:hypothetical protein
MAEGIMPQCTGTTVMPVLRANASTPLAGFNRQELLLHSPM